MQQKGVNNLRMCYLDGSVHFFLNTRMKYELFSFFSQLNTPYLLRKLGW